MKHQRPIDRHPAFDHRAQPKPRRPPEFDASYNPLIHLLAFDLAGNLCGYKPRSSVSTTVSASPNSEPEGTQND